MIDDLLPFVEKPSRYLGSEINIIKKDHSQVKLRFALAFPDLYEIGTSHFGMQILYHILNADPDIAAERVFAPGVDMEALLRNTGQSLFSLESRAPLRRFDIIGFSLLYELNFTNVLTILDLANIPFLAADRDHSHPLIIAGGPCTCNPEPMADFFDAMVVGDGENVIKQMTTEWLQWKNDDPDDRGSLLQRWSQIGGVYIPSFFDPQFDDRGFQTLIPRFSDYTRVKRAIVDDLDRMPFPLKPVIPFGKPIHDRLRLEVARGCTRGCRFCQAGMIYRPVRERSPENLLSLAADSHCGDRLRRHFFAVFEHRRLWLSGAADGAADGSLWFRQCRCLPALPAGGHVDTGTDGTDQAGAQNRLHHCPGSRQPTPA